MAEVKLKVVCTFFAVLEEHSHLNESKAASLRIAAQLCVCLHGTKCRVIVFPYWGKKMNIICLQYFFLWRLEIA